jgi:xylulose-5-phosphate/fructose-6-phosphate phosphoketolase
VKTVHAEPLDRDSLGRIDLYWRAANYLSVGQIYLVANPLLDEPLTDRHVKSRLLGHWGTTPGLNFLYAHLNRVIAARDLDMVFVAGPGHGGPALVANTWLEGSWSDIYPEVGRDREGMTQLFRQFSFPGGIPSHVAADVPGSIHEGGELGYSLSHAFGAAFDNPSLVVACVIGDGEAETGPLAASWHSNKFLDPVGDGAVLPILHLNGYKISNPALLDRLAEDELAELLHGCGWDPYLVEGDDPATVHQHLAGTFDVVLDEIAAIQRRARSEGFAARPRWPMVVFRTPKGWTGPKEVDGNAVEGTWRSHQVPFANVRGHRDRLAMLETWMRSYGPEELFGADGQPLDDLVSWLPTGARRMGSNPHANGGGLLRALSLPEIQKFGVEVDHPGSPHSEPTKVLGAWLREVIRSNAAQKNIRLFGPDETASNRLDAVYEVTNKVWQAGTCQVVVAGNLLGCLD